MRQADQYRKHLAPIIDVLPSRSNDFRRIRSQIALGGVLHDSPLLLHKSQGQQAFGCEERH